MKKTIVEICVTSAGSAAAACRGGADRVELCTGLEYGGTTPSAGLIAETRLACRRKMHVLIRPRPGDFHYSRREFDTMRRDILIAKAIGADGVVLGLLTPKGSVDVARTGRLVTLARPMSVTFHRAFDSTDDPFRSLEEVIETGADRILTSGFGKTAVAGERVLRELVLRATRRISIIAAGTISDKTVRRLVHSTGVTELHIGTAVLVTRKTVADTSMHGFGLTSETDAGKVSRIVTLLRS